MWLLLIMAFTAVQAKILNAQIFQLPLVCDDITIHSSPFFKEKKWERHTFDVTSIKRNETIKLVVAVVENKFIAHGLITDTKRAPRDMQKFAMHIEKVEQFDNCPNLGKSYSGKTVEIFSEIGIPHSFEVGVEVSVILRIFGDEWGQTLFLVGVIDDEKK